MKLKPIAILLFSISFLYGQEQGKQPAQTPVKTVDEKGMKIRDQNIPAGNTDNNLALDLRLMGGIGLPMGSLSKTGLGLGGGGQLNAELKLPFMLGPLQLKTGIAVGFYGLGVNLTSTKISASVFIIPVLAYTEIAYPIKPIGLTPYLAIGGGGSSLSFKTTGTGSISGSSFDGTLLLRLGTAYILPPVPRLSINLNLDYLIIFEQDLAGQPNNGQLLNIELGVAYKIF